VKEYSFAVDESGSYWFVLDSDPSDGRVLQIEKRSFVLPENHPVERVAAKVEYGWVKIDGKSHLLPIKAETLSCYRHFFECRKNDIDFRNYRKFEVESKLVP
jgi:hypothetical protein